MEIIEKFLKAKHWQIFLLTFGIPIILQMILMPIMLESNNPEIAFKFVPIISLIFMVTFFGWFWAVAVGLQNKVPENVKMKVRKFKIFFIIPMVYMVLIFGFMLIGISALENGANPSPLFPLIIVPIHLFSMFCIFYCLYFVAKTFKTVELQKEVSFSDFAGEFFMIWFFPIGIWVIQPKINKMIE